MGNSKFEMRNSKFPLQFRRQEIYNPESRRRISHFEFLIEVPSSGNLQSEIEAQHFRISNFEFRISSWLFSTKEANAQSPNKK
jgi:hypothetical protein